MDDIVRRLLVGLALIAINAFFVTAEFSLVTVRRSRISQLVESGDRPARSVQFLQRRLDRPLATSQLGITLVTLGLGWLSHDSISLLIGFILQRFTPGPAYLPLVAQGVAVPVVFVLIAYLQIVLGELCPKSWALLYPEQLARRFAPSLQAIAQVLSPIIWGLNQSSRWLLKLGGADLSRSRWVQRLTPEELQLIIAKEGESSGLNTNERSLLSNVFAFSDRLAHEIMVPRAQLVALPANLTLNDLLQAISASGHHQYPVKGESLDDIRGMIDFHDLASPLLQGILQADTSLANWIKPVRFFPETTPLTDLLLTMQRSSLQTAIVVDEFGGTAGLVSLENLIAEMVGSEQGDENEDTVLLQMVDPQTFLVEAQMNLEELNEILNFQFPLRDQYQTLGGFLLYTWQKIPAQGESLEYGDFTFSVIAADGPKLQKIRIHRHGSGAIVKQNTSAIATIS